jgi:hypothetical protein
VEENLLKREDINRLDRQVARTSRSCSILSDVRILASSEIEGEHMRRLLAAITLACLISVVAMGGDIPISDSPAPPPPSLTSSTAPGDIPSVGATDQLSSDALSALLAALTFLAV